MFTDNIALSQDKNLSCKFHEHFHNIAGMNIFLS